jgi:tetratricopeptide (TPR) repeat protein
MVVYPMHAAHPQTLIPLRTNARKRVHMRRFVAYVTLAALVYAPALSKAEDASHDAWSLNKEAVRLTNQGKWAQGIPLLEMAVTLARQTPNFDKKRLGEIHQNLGMAYWNTKDYTNSIRELEAVLATDKYLQSLSPFNLASFRTYLADSYNHADRFADAAHTLEAARPEIGSHYGTDSANYAWVLASLGKWGCPLG